MDERARSAVRHAVETLAVGVEADVPQQERSELIAAGVASLLAAVTDQPAEAITPDRPLLLESLQAAHLQAVLDAGFGVSLPLADLADGVSVAAVSQLLLAGTAAAPAPEPSAALDPAARHQPFDLTDVQQAYLLGREHAHELGNVDAAFYVELATRRSRHRPIRARVPGRCRQARHAAGGGHRGRSVADPGYRCRTTPLRARI